MTKEIIIDGVNVAGCVRLQDDKISCDLGGECNGWENCYYKQFKRLEQENKELKEWKDKVVKLFESACRCKYLNEETDICSYTNEKCININKCTYKYQELSDNYRSALEEIQELSNIDKEWAVFMQPIDRLEKIKKIVNEVLQ